MADQVFNSEDNQGAQKLSRSKKLQFISENIASLSDDALDNIAGGLESGSTCSNLTCGWCTQTRDSGKDEPQN